MIGYGALLLPPAEVWLLWINLAAVDFVCRCFPVDRRRRIGTNQEVGVAALMRRNGKQHNTTTDYEQRYVRARQRCSQAHPQRTSLFRSRGLDIWFAYPNEK
jgi:hypothetical protein